MQFDGYIVHFRTNTNIGIRISHQHQCQCHNHHQHHQYVIRMRSSASSLFIAPRHNHPYFHIAYTPAIAWFEGIINTWLSWFSDYMHLWFFVYIYIYIGQWQVWQSGVIGIRRNHHRSSYNPHGPFPLEYIAIVSTWFGTHCFDRDCGSTASPTESFGG